MHHAGVTSNCAVIFLFYLRSGHCASIPERGPALIYYINELSIIRSFNLEHLKFVLNLLWYLNFEQIIWNYDFHKILNTVCRLDLFTLVQVVHYKLFAIVIERILQCVKQSSGHFDARGLEF